MYRFEPGSYQVPAGFFPAIACYKISNDKEYFDYILVNPNLILETENEAVQKSTMAINKAFNKRKESGSDIIIAESLKIDGYKKVEDPRFAQ
jgi:hypothetical protein